MLDVSFQKLVLNALENAFVYLKQRRVPGKDENCKGDNFQVASWEGLRRQDNTRDENDPLRDNGRSTNGRMREGERRSCF